MRILSGLAPAELANQTRPTWMAGKIPAQVTAKMVWQLTQVAVGGIAAWAAWSTVLWQCRQSIFSALAYSLWLNGTGCFGEQPAWIVPGAVPYAPTAPM